MFVSTCEAVVARKTGSPDAEEVARTCPVRPASRGAEWVRPTDADRAQTSFASVAEDELCALRRLIG